MAQIYATVNRQSSDGTKKMQTSLVMRTAHGSKTRDVAPRDRTMKSIYSGKGINPVYLYAAYCKKFAKIGITENPKNRVCVMQSGNPFLVELLCFFPLPVADAMAAEREVMLALSDVHWFGDWFTCSRSHARFVVQSVFRKFEANPTGNLVRPQFVMAKAPGLRRQVRGPDGVIFESCSKAAEHLGITRQAMSIRLAKRQGDWKWADE